MKENNFHTCFFSFYKKKGCENSRNKIFICVFFVSGKKSQNLRFKKKFLCVSFRFAKKIREFEVEKVVQQTVSKERSTRENFGGSSNLAERC